MSNSSGRAGRLCMGRKLASRSLLTGYQITCFLQHAKMTMGRVVVAKKWDYSCILWLTRGQQLIAATSNSTEIIEQLRYLQLFGVVTAFQKKQDTHRNTTGMHKIMAINVAIRAHFSTCRMGPIRPLRRPLIAWTMSRQHGKVQGGGRIDQFSAMNPYNSYRLSPNYAGARFCWQAAHDLWWSMVISELGESL
jgi:hypothetical protein